MRFRRLVALAGAVLAALTVLTISPAPALAAKQAGDPPPCLQPPPTVHVGVPWPQLQLSPERVWPLTNGSGIVVAVVDTGVDAQTPQLVGRVLRGIDVMKPDKGEAYTDCYGHGTFVAGIIAAAPAEGTGFVGMAPGVRILPVRVATNADDVTAAAIADGIRAAVDSGVRVVNVSASTTVKTPALEEAVRYAESRDVVVVASAANSAQNGDPVTYPAAYPTVIAVGAIDSSGQHAAFSQTGPYLDLVAPGVDVVSVGPHGPGHWLGSGTSYAAPFVSATVALVRAYRPGLSAAQIRHRLQVTASHPAADLPDPEFGWGVVNPEAAVSAVLPEESGAEAKAVTPPPAPAPDVPALDEFGPVMVVIGIFLGMVLVFMLVLWHQVGPRGQARGWRRARVVRVVSRKPASAEQSSGAHPGEPARPDQPGQAAAPATANTPPAHSG